MAIKNTGKSSKTLSTTSSVQRELTASAKVTEKYSSTLFTNPSVWQAMSAQKAQEKPEAQKKIDEVMKAYKGPAIVKQIREKDAANKSTLAEVEELRTADNAFANELMSAGASSVLVAAQKAGAYVPWQKITPDSVHTGSEVALLRANGYDFSQKYVFDGQELTFAQYHFVQKAQALLELQYSNETLEKKENLLNSLLDKHNQAQRIYISTNDPVRKKQIEAFTAKVNTIYPDVHAEFKEAFDTAQTSCDKYVKTSGVIEALFQGETARELEQYGETREGILENKERLERFQEDLAKEKASFEKLPNPHPKKSQQIFDLRLFSKEGGLLLGQPIPGDYPKNAGNNFVFNRSKRFATEQQNDLNSEKSVPLNERFASFSEVCTQEPDIVPIAKTREG